MELVCIDKQTFEELRVRFCEFEDRVTRLCRPVEDLGLKNWLDNQEVCDVLRINKKTLQAYRAKGLLPFSRIKNKLFYKPEDSVMEDVPRSLFNGERFLTDEELSKVLRVSRRTLQEYRTFGVIPYYLVQGKALYKESDIMKILDDAYKRCREEQRWV